MKSYGYAYLLFLALGSSVLINAADIVEHTCNHKGPLNNEWFSSEISPYYQANQLLDNGDWNQARNMYKKTQKHYASLHDKDDIFRFIKDRSSEEIEYDQHMAGLNSGLCSIACAETMGDLISMDSLIDIPLEKRISKSMIDSRGLKGKSVLVRTDKIRVDEIMYFLEAANLFRKRAGCFINFSAEFWLRPLLSSPTGGYGFTLVYDSKAQQKAHYVTHLVSLAGYLGLRPADLIPKKIVFEVPDHSDHLVKCIIKESLKGNKQIKRFALILLGDNVPVTLMGGRKLPNNPEVHGRHLDTGSLNQLLRNNPDLALICYGKGENRMIPDRDQTKRVVPFVELQSKYDILVALAHYMNVNNNVVSLCSNTDAHVLIRCLNSSAQERAACIISNPGECSPLMAGIGLEYRHPSSNCRVYVCESPSDQASVIQKAYRDMVNISRHNELMEIE